MTKVTINTPDYVRKSLNVFLIIITSILGVVTFFAIQDILMLTTAFIVAHTSAESWTTVQDTYVVITVRNFWVFIGGIILLTLLIVGIDYHSRRIGNSRTTKILMWTLLVEVILIGISLLF